MLYNFSTAAKVVTGISSIFVMIMIRRWFVKQKTIFCKLNASLSSLHVVITGGTSGIGRATAYELARRKCRITIGCRDLDAGKRLCKDITSSTGNALIGAKWLDLLQPLSIERFVEEIPSINVLINNAGVMPSTCREVPAFAGVPLEVAVNYLSHYYLTNLLINKGLLQPSADEEINDYPRVVIVSSSLAAKGSTSSLLLPAPTVSGSWKSMQGYADSKLACCLFAQELHRRFGQQFEENKQPIGVYCLFTGGMVNTNLNRELLNDYPSVLRGFFRFLSWAFLKTPQQGCQTVVHCTVHPRTSRPDENLIIDGVAEKTLVSGGLYSNSVRIPWPTAAGDKYQAQELWQQTRSFLQHKCALTLR